MKVPNSPAAGLPSCAHCGNTTGPWQPSGQREPNGAQIMICSDGHGCAQDTYATRVARKIRAERDRTEVPLLLIADVVRLDLPEVLDRYEGRVPWNLDQVELLSALFGVTPISLLEVTEW